MRAGQVTQDILPAPEVTLRHCPLQILGERLPVWLQAPLPVCAPALPLSSPCPALRFSTEGFPRVILADPDCSLSPALAGGSAVPHPLLVLPSTTTHSLLLPKAQAQPRLNSLQESDVSCLYVTLPCNSISSFLLPHSFIPSRFL